MCGLRDRVDQTPRIQPDLKPAANALTCLVTPIMATAGRVNLAGKVHSEVVEDLFEGLSSEPCEGGFRNHV